MKINGHVLKEPYKDFVVIPRLGIEPGIVITAVAVLDDSECYKLNPMPSPPKKTIAGGKEQEDVDDPGYKQLVNNWWRQHDDWIYLQSLKATEGLEWDTVNYIDPSTWSNWRKDLQNAGFSFIEINRITRLVQEVNALDESKINEARERFLAIQRAIQQEATS